MKSGKMTARAAVTTLALLALAVAATVVSGQTAEGEPSDLDFTIVNGTTGEPVTVERMVIEYVSARRDKVADFAPDGATFTARDVPIKEIGRYIITLWHQGVPYWWDKRGQTLREGTVTLHVFDTTSSLEGVSFSGLNVVVRREESLVRLEYMGQINNDARPQVTVVDRRATFAFALPAGVTNVTATYQRGPDPTTFEVSDPGPRGGLAIPLIPGANQFRLVAVVPWSEGMVIPIGSDLPLTSWSMLAAPEWLEVGSTDVEENDSEKVTGFRRYAGFAIDAGEVVELRLTTGEQGPGPAEDLFSEGAPADRAEEGTEDEEGGRSPLPLIFLGVLIIVIILASFRRRS